MIISELTPFITHDPARERFHRPLGAVETRAPLRLAFSDARSDVRSAELVIEGDGGFEQRWEMSPEGGDWCCTVTVPEEPAALWYNFRLTLESGELWLSAAYGGRFGQLMSTKGEGFRLTVYERGFRTPEWFRRSVMYQIFPDRFARDASDTARRGVERHRAMGRDVKYHEDWSESVDWQPNSADGFYFPLDFFGGTFKGIEEKLGYIASLGVGVIYLNPIVEARSNHRYDAGDYMQPDQILGSLEDFERLCAAAKERGIRIMLDGVFSHTGADSVYFNRDGRYPSQGAYNAGPASPYYSWYDFRKWPDEYRCWWNFPDLPEVNELDPGWEELVITGEDSVVKTWLRRGAEGWRLDVADELPDGTLAKIRAAVKAEKPEAVVLGEVWEDAVTKFSYGARRKYALGGALDTVMNYPFRSAVLDFLCFRTNSWALKGFLISQRLHYPQPMYFALMNLLSSHDVERARTALATRLDARSMTREQQARFIVSDSQDARGAAMQKLAAALQFAVPGVPCVYYGDETGMNGMLDPFNRAPFTEGARPLTDWYRALGAAHARYDALKCGSAAFFAPHPDVLCVLRCVTGGRDCFGSEAGDGVLLCAVNRSGAETETVCDLWLDNAGLTGAELKALAELNLTRGECVLSGEGVEVENGLVKLRLPAESARLYILH